MPEDAALVTDLYELTMTAAYRRLGMDGTATFELFVRRLPDQRNFLVACGIEPAVEYLEHLRFTAGDIDYLRTLAMFDEDFLASLAELRFTGEVWAVPEGEVVFAEEPLMRVTAPLPEAQLVETFLLATITFETMIASKAARVAIACGPDRTFVDFSGRRDHGPAAAVEAARAAFVGGAAATSNVEAGRRWGVPLNGTMAHSYVLSFADEHAAFSCYARTFPDRAVFLIDTYDTEQGARIAAAVAKEVEAEGISVRGVRLDSGDLESLSRSVRVILDEAGCRDIQIFASNDLDEHRIAALGAEGAPIDGFGVGTMLGTSADAPYLSGVYKLVEDQTGGKAKLSSGKRSWPGRKQVYRQADRDVIAVVGEDPPPAGTPLLSRFMAGGRRTRPSEDLSAARQRCRDAVAALPPALRDLQKRAHHPVERVGQGS
ncbi:MAG: nicotinate phosphoribosyltransferase [Actinomycetota bacterium]